MNPFVKTVTIVHTQVGFFAVAVPDPKSTALSERICTAIAKKLASNKSTILDANTWLSDVEMIPEIIQGSVSSDEIQSQTTKTGLPGKIAVQAVAFAHPTAATKNIQTAIKRYLGTVPDITDFLCLVLDQSVENTILIQFTSIKVNGEDDALSLGTTTSSFTLNLTNAKTVRRLEDIFGDLAPLKGMPYYLRVS